MPNPGMSRKVEELNTRISRRSAAGNLPLTARMERRLAGSASIVGSSASYRGEGG
jgi:hypothetical protein